MFRTQGAKEGQFRFLARSVGAIGLPAASERGVIQRRSHETLAATTSRGRRRGCDRGRAGASRTRSCSPPNRGYDRAMRGAVLLLVALYALVVAQATPASRRDE